MTMKISLVPRKFPVGSNPESNSGVARSIVLELIDSLTAAKLNEKKRAKEQYCRGMLCVYAFFLLLIFGYKYRHNPLYHL